MKTKLEIAAFYILAVVLGGCVPSLHPLFNNSDIIFDSNLVGKWNEPNENNYWEFKVAADKKYDVIYIDEKGIGKFEGRLGKIGKDLFLDIYPQDMNIPGNDYYKAHLIGAHTFLKITSLDKGLDIEGMNSDSLNKLLVSEPNAIKYEKVDDRIILTASTQELQNFIKKYSNDSKVNIYGQATEGKLFRKVK